MHIATEVLGRDSRGFLYRANKQEIDIKTKPEPWRKTKVFL